MRRVLPIALLLLSPSLAFAQDADPKPEPKPEPDPKPLMPPPDPNGPPAVVQVEDDPTPIRLSAIIAQAASVQRRARIAEGVLGIVAGGGGIASGAVLLTLDTGSKTNDDGMKIIGGIAIGFGGLTILTSVWDLFSRNSLERLDDAYAPIAHDKSIPAAKRLAEGENALESLAASGRSSRIFSGVTSIVIGAAFGIAAAPLAFAIAPNVEQIDPVTMKPVLDSNGKTIVLQENSTIRAYLGFGLGLSAFLMVASGVTTIVVKRTEAEQLWNLWLAGTGRPTAKLQPYLTPSGVGLRF